MKMNRQPNIALRRERLVQFFALGWLLLLGGLALAGPYGVLAWGENLSVLEMRQAKIVELRQEKARLQNLVGLLDPRHVDPDLATELFRRDLNVAHPDEFILDLNER